MLDENEDEVISRMCSGELKAAKEFRQKNSLPLEDLSIEEIFCPVCEKSKK